MSAVFEWTCQELERATHLDRLEARGTIRLVLKHAGLEVETVAAKQMAVTLRKVLGGELGKRGVEDPETICERLASGVEAAGIEDAAQANSAESVFSRLGKS